MRFAITTHKHSTLDWILYCFISAIAGFGPFIVNLDGVGETRAWIEDKLANQIGETGRGAKRRADNVGDRNKSHANSHSVQDAPTT